jgi:hypothetical protein
MPSEAASAPLESSVKKYVCGRQGEFVMGNTLLHELAGVGT